MAPMRNMTIMVPEGTTYYRANGLLCTPFQDFEILAFYVMNYFAHAITVKRFPGEQLSSYVKAIIFASLYPYSGILRGIDGLVRRAVLVRGGALQKAAAAGALCVVTRSADWVPENGQILRGVTLPEFQSATNSRSLSWVVELPTYFQEAGLSGPILSRAYRQIHGAYRLPIGYEFAILPSNTLVDVAFPGELNEIFISWSHSIVKSLLSVAQFSYLTYTLVRGSPTNTHGYADLKFTVLPYLYFGMSLFNIMGNFATPEFETTYMVRSPEMQEAEDRGGCFDGVIGRVLEGRLLNGLHEDEMCQQRWVFRVGASQDQPREHARDSDYDERSSSTTQIAGHADSADNISLDHRPSAHESDSYSLKSHPKIQHSIYRAYTRTMLPNVISDRILSSTPSTVTVSACTPFETTPDNCFGLRYTGSVLLACFFIIVPYAVNFRFTHFEPGQSTPLQQIFTMSWHAFGILWGVFIYPYLVAYIDIYLDEKQIREAKSKWVRCSQQYSVILVQVIVIGVFATGGFVMVGQMLKEYGSCKVID